MLKEIQKILVKQGVDAFLVPSNDAFLSEFTPDYANRLQAVTNFTGSAGIALILQKKAVFFTDGRYMLQAKDELKQGFELIDITKKSLRQYLQENIPDCKIGFDPELHSVRTIVELENKGFKVVPLDKNPIDKLWKNRPEEFRTMVEAHPLKYSGMEIEDKIEQITQVLDEEKADAFVISAPDSVCWLLNIRARDIEYTPLVLCNAIIYANGTVDLIIDENRISDEVREHLGQKVNIVDLDDVDALFRDNKRLGGDILLDPSNCNYKLFKDVGSDKVEFATDPCIHRKAGKNKNELLGAVNAHIKDGVAVVRFLKWFEENVSKQEVTEMDVADKLLEFRQQDPEFVCPSFATIAGFAENGAIIHYRATKKTSKTIKGKGVLLVDSGGQYRCGTTDITRTIAVGKPTWKQRRNFTLVLKGHIALAMAQFELGTRGSQLDPLARKFLKKKGLDYEHGTGHGVGSYLGVHEGPQRIAQTKNDHPIDYGMITSNEPGYYKEGEYGIRIENLIVAEHVEEADVAHKMLGFRTITMAPLDKKLIVKLLLNRKERKWLREYHNEIFDNLSPYLEADEQKWLKKACKF